MFCERQIYGADYAILNLAMSNDVAVNVVVVVTCIFAVVCLCFNHEIYSLGLKDFCYRGVLQYNFTIQKVISWSLKLSLHLLKLLNFSLQKN
jgi:hypothetical protein